MQNLKNKQTIRLCGGRTGLTFLYRWIAHKFPRWHAHSCNNTRRAADGLGCRPACTVSTQGQGRLQHLMWQTDYREKIVHVTHMYFTRLTHVWRIFFSHYFPSIPDVYVWVCEWAVYFCGGALDKPRQKDKAGWIGPCFLYQQQCLFSVSLVSKRGQCAAKETQMIKIKVLWLNAVFRACGTKYFQFCSFIEILMTSWEHLALNDVLQEHKSDRPQCCPESDYAKEIKWVRCLPPLVFEALNAQSSSSQLRLRWM